MEVSQIAVNQWKQLCKRHISTHSSIVINKIKRAHDLGQVVHIYKDGNRITRYHDLNLLVSCDEIQTIWRDATIPDVEVNEKLKEMYEKVEFLF